MKVQHNLEQCLNLSFSDVYQMVERPSRPNSVQQMVPNGQYQDWKVQPRQGQLQSASMSSLNAFGPQLNQLQTGTVAHSIHAYGYFSSAVKCSLNHINTY